MKRWILSLAAATLLHTGNATAEQQTRSAEIGTPAPEAGEADDDRAVTLEIGGGLEYDSNVALLEIDTSTNAGDMIRLLSLALGYQLPSEGRFGFSTGYNFSDTQHEDFGAFDVRLHRASGTLSWDFGRVDIGSILQYAEADLDGSDFLTLEQTSPYVSTLVGEKLFLRFAYSDTDKDFASNPLRAAQASAWSTDVYWFLDGLTTYLLFGIRADDEDAIDPQFDYTGDRHRVQISHRFTVGSRQLTFKAGIRSETRDYGSVTPLIGQRRQDDRLQFEASAELPVGERLSADFSYQRTNNESNLPAVDFDEDVVSVRVTAGF